MSNGHTKLLVVKRWIDDVEFEIARSCYTSFGIPNAFDFSLDNLLYPFVGRPFDDIDVARLQSGETHGCIANLTHDDAIHKSFVSPIVAKALEDHPLSRLPLDELERTGPRRKGGWFSHSFGQGFFGTGRESTNVRQHRQKQRIDFFERNFESVFVNRLDFFNLIQVGQAIVAVFCIYRIVNG